ncbi:MAG TPA: SRPBCC family protein [Candidatus Nitrosotenuis sp.]|jgi:ribosome-associated toxin RatA of RatAB toxin-antitoxin module|nr:SRPBCC family protein [Candidatus Nitrosotenuis sp.]
MPYVEREILMAGEPGPIYELAKDMESFPQFMRDVQSVKVIRRQGATTVTEWEAEVDGVPIMWTEEDTFDDAAYRIHYRLIEGDLDKFEGEWRFERVDGGTRVVLTVDFDFGLPELTNLIGDTLQLKVIENCDMMLQGMKARVEGVPCGEA